MFVRYPAVNILDTQKCQQESEHAWGTTHSSVPGMGRFLLCAVPCARHRIYRYDGEPHSPGIECNDSSISHAVKLLWRGLE